eukprot:3051137-Alexandrium_andersonii.AAC.1
MARGCDGNQPRGSTSAVPRQRGAALRAWSCALAVLCAGQRRWLASAGGFNTMGGAIKALPCISTC